ncbi:hypothetical protein GP486_006582, partial [Trichoglossum hirsutum]
MRMTRRPLSWAARKGYEEVMKMLLDKAADKSHVIFVHGFTGHPQRTWTYSGEVSTDDGATHDNDSSERPSKFRRLVGSDSFKRAAPRRSVFWPQDLLPKTLVNSRIFTYGYDSNIRHRLGAPVNKTTVYDLGHNLLLSLEAKRRSQPSRPLVFIAHSLGGIVVKEALRRSEGYRACQTHLYSIYDATVALICFGTPHSGADPRSVVCRVAEAVVRLTGFTVNDQLINSLLPRSEQLRELREEFSKMSRAKNWMLYSFQEQYGLKVLNGDKVVEDISSTFGDPTIEIAQHIAGNHMDMCRFKGLDDREYEKVAAALSRIYQVIEDNTRQLKAMGPSVVEQLKRTAVVTEKQRKACLGSLSFQQIDSRFLNIRKAHDRTCNWLFDQLEYKRWLSRDLTDEHHGFLWIKGKPGAGKSTMMKHALSQTQKILTDATIISFFFNARGSILEKSTLGMYRSLLFQLLTAIPALQDVFIPIFLVRTKHSDIYEWNVKELQEICIKAVEGLQRNRLICFIDALDECEEDEVREMVEFLERLAEAAISSGTSLNICLSSRHYPHISIRNGIQLVIEGQDGHDRDIAAYVQGKLNAPSCKQTDDIKAEILNRASGVFLWVVLVVQMLNKAYDHGRIHALRRRLNEIPDELDELFADVLRRDAETRDESALCLQWILFAQRPLKREELYFAVLSGTEPAALGKWDPDEVNHQTIDRFILSCSKGLAEVSKAKDRTVQFIHESVRDFFLLRDGLAKLQPDLVADVTGLSQERLKQCCYQYITTDMFEHLLNDALPGAKTPMAQDLRKTTSEEFPIFQQHQIRRYTPQARLLYILSEKNLPNLTTALLDDKVDIDAMGERYGNAIQAASAGGHEKIVRLLIDAGANINVVGGEYYHPLAAAIARDHKVVIRQLLDRTVISAQHILDDQLLKSVKGGYVDVARLLLANPKVDPNIKNKGGETPLLLAARDGYEAIVQLLLANSKVDPNSKDLKDNTPLSVASCNGNEAVVELLLANPKTDPNPKNGDGKTPLL